MSTTHTPPYLGAGPGTENVGSSLIGLGMSLQRPLDGLIEAHLSPMRPSSASTAHLAPRSSASHLRSGLPASAEIKFSSSSSPSLSMALSAHPAPSAALLWPVGHDGLGHDTRNPPHGVLSSPLRRPRPLGTGVPELGSHAYHPLLVWPAAVRGRGAGLFAAPVGPSLGSVVGERCAVLASGGGRAGGRDPGAEGGRPFHLLGPARLYGQPVLCDLHDRFDWHQERLLAHPEEAPGAHLQEAHLALLGLYVEVLHAAYALPYRVVDVFAAHVVLGVCGHEVRVAKPHQPYPCACWVRHRPTPPLC